MKLTTRIAALALAAFMTVGCGATLSSTSSVQASGDHCETTSPRSGSSMAMRARSGRTVSLDAPLMRTTVCEEPPASPAVANR